MRRTPDANCGRDLRAVDHRQDRARIDARARVRRADAQRSAACDGAARRAAAAAASCRRPSSGTGRRRRVPRLGPSKTTSYAPARRPDRAGGGRGLAELAQVRIQVDRQRGLAEEAVLVARSHDPRLDADTLGAPDDRDAEVRRRPAQPDAKDLLGPGERRRSPPRRRHPRGSGSSEPARSRLASSPCADRADGAVARCLCASDGAETRSQ